jgi:ribonuclease R
MPRKSNKGKTEKLSTKQLEYRLQEFFAQNPTKPYNADRLIAELKVANNKDSVQHVLLRMLEKNVVMPSKSGLSYVLYDAEKLGTIDDVEGEIATVTQHGKKSDNVATGVVDITRSGAAFIESADSGLSKDIYVPQNRMSNALHGDKVAIRWWVSSRGRPEGEVTRVLERHSDQFIGTYTVAKQYTFVVPDNPSMLYDIIVDKDKPTTAKDGDKVIVAVRNWHDPRRNNFTLSGEIIAVLGQSGSSDIEMQSILLEHGFSLAFPEQALRENDAIKEEIPAEEIAKRADFRKITTFTIDPLTAKDFDDALSYELLENGNIKIGVHIADVTHYVTPKSALDEEAAKRTTSVYLVDRVLPMLPEKLSNGVCSLRPNEDKLTFAAVFEFSPKGEMLGEWFGKTVIHSDRRFTYEEAQEIIENKKGEFAKELLTLNTFAQKLRKLRFKSGALGFESSEVQFKLDENGKPIGIYTKVRKDAHFLVEEFMLLANKRVATCIVDSFKTSKVQTPFVYRIHDLPDMEKVANFVQFAQVFGYEMKIKSPKTISQSFAKLMKEIEGKPEQDVLQQMAIRTMAKAAYSTKNIGHYGLAFENYSHFTSPIRRYADVLAHRLLADFLDKKTIRMTADKLEETCLYISKKERKAMEAERASVKYKQVEFLQDHIGSVFQGVITGMTDRGIYVEIIENRCEGMVSFADMYDEFKFVDNFHIRSTSAAHKMGDVIWIRVLSANLAKRQINMAMLAEKEENDTTMQDAANAEKAAFKAQQEAKRNVKIDAQEDTDLTPVPFVAEEPVAEPAPAKKAKAKTKAQKAAEEKAEAEAKAAAEKAEAEKLAAEKAAEKTTKGKKGSKAADKAVEKPAEKVVEKAVEKPAEKAVEKAPLHIKKSADAPALSHNVPPFAVPAFTKANALLAQSNVKGLAGDATWGVQLTETFLQRNQSYILDFNPTAAKKQSYTSQTSLPADNVAWQSSPAFQMSAPLFEEYFPEQELAKISQMYACPLRSENEEQITPEDFEQGFPAFMALLAERQPRRLVSYSNLLRDYLMNKKLIVELQQERVDSGKRQFLVARGFIKVGDQLTPIAFLPSLKVKIDAEARRLAWAWAVMP